MLTILFQPLYLSLGKEVKINALRVTAECYAKQRYFTKLCRKMLVGIDSISLIIKIHSE